MCNDPCSLIWFSTGAQNNYKLRRLSRTRRSHSVLLRQDDSNKIKRIYLHESRVLRIITNMISVLIRQVKDNVNRSYKIIFGSIQMKYLGAWKCVGYMGKSDMCESARSKAFCKVNQKVPNAKMLYFVIILFYLFLAGYFHTVPVQWPKLPSSWCPEKGSCQIVCWSASLPDRTHGRCCRMFRKYLSFFLRRDVVKTLVTSEISIQVIFWSKNTAENFSLC